MAVAASGTIPPKASNLSGFNERERALIEPTLSELLGIVAMVSHPDVERLSVQAGIAHGQTPVRIEQYLIKASAVIPAAGDP